MIPQAHIVHQVRGRLRLKVPEMRQEEEYFTEASRLLGSIPGVAEVTVNHLTASIVIRHPEVAFDELRPLIDGFQLFEIVEAAPVAGDGSAIKPVYQGFSYLNETLNETSAGKVNLSSIGFMGLVSMAMLQIYRGNIMAPAVSLLFSAFDLAQRMQKEKE